MCDHILFTVMKKNKAEQSHMQFIPAQLPAFKRTRVRGEKYPAAYKTGSASDCLNGVLITGLDKEDMVFLDHFEGDEYERVMVTVKIDDSNTEDLYVYNWTDPLGRLIDEDWDDSWLKDPVQVDQWLKVESQRLIE